MYLRLAQDPALYALLLRGDAETSARAGDCACAWCGGPLYQANYPRKPRGMQVVPEGYWVRSSFCCGVEGCRKRCTPPSVRFLGRRVYVGAVVLLATAMLHGVNARRAAELRALFGMDVRTLERWRQWWLDAFVRSETWQSLRAMLIPAVDPLNMPLSLVERRCDPQDVGKLAVLLRGFGALTTGSCAVRF